MTYLDNVPLPPGHYDGHNRKAGVSARNDTAKWRRIRRGVGRWLRERFER